MIYLLDMTRYAAILLGLIVPGCASGPGPASAQDTPREPVRTLDVSAHATVTRTPDVAVIRLAVETHAPTARQATRGNAEAMSAVVSRLRELGIESSAIRTESISLNPRYERGQEREAPVIAGYQALNRVSVRIDDVSAVGRVVDGAIEAGANRVEGIQFQLSDPEAAYHEALEQAVASARREAEVLARAMGVRLGDPIRVSTGGVRVPVQQGGMPEMMRAAATPVEPGELEVGASVHITYRLGP